MQDSRGFTLVETLIASTLLAVLFAVAYPVLVNTAYNWNRGQEKIDLQQNLRLAMDRISREVRQATELITTAEGGNPNAVLRFKGSDGVEVKYYLDSNNQILRYASGGANVVAYGVQAVYFEFMRPAGVTFDRVYIRLTSLNQLYTLESTVTPRLRLSKN